MAGRPAGWLAAALESPKGGTTGLAATAWLCQIIKVSKGAKASRGNTRETGGNKQASYTRSGTVDDDSRSPGLIGLTIFRPDGAREKRGSFRDDLLCVRRLSCEFRYGMKQERGHGPRSTKISLMCLAGSFQVVTGVHLGQPNSRGDSIVEELFYPSPVTETISIVASRATKAGKFTNGRSGTSNELSGSTRQL